MIWEAYKNTESIAFQNEQEAIDFCASEEGDGYAYRQVVPTVLRFQNWVLLQGLLYGDSEIYGLAFLNAIPNSFSLVLKLITDGMIGEPPSDEVFLSAFQSLGIVFTEVQITRLNGYFEQSGINVVYSNPNPS